MPPNKRFDRFGQPEIEEAGPKVRAIAVRSWNDPSAMLGDVGKIFATLSKFGVNFLGTGSTHHCASGRGDADITILFECDDRTYAQIRREPAVSGSRELDPHTVMRHLDADVMDATSGEIAALRKQHRANIIQRLLLDCTPTSLHRVTKHLTRFNVAMTGVKKPEGKVQREKIVPYRVYVQNIRDSARMALANLMDKKKIAGGWGNKTTVRLNGNVVDVRALEDHLRAHFPRRLDRLDLGPVSAVNRDQTQDTVRVAEIPS